MTRDGDRDGIAAELDGLLPGEIDRRRFLGATAVAIGATFTGYLGQDDGGEGVINRNVTWRQPWAPEPTWAIAYVAEQDGYWNDAGITPPSVREGFGSPDTSRRVGTGEEEIGQAEMGSCINGIVEGQDLRFFAISKPRSLLGFIYRQDRIEGVSDLAGSQVGLASPFAEETWPLFVDLAEIDGDEVSADYVEEDAAPGQLAEGNLDAIWGALDLLGTYRSQMPEDVELGVVPLNNYSTVFGYPLIVNGAWLEDDEENVEYLTRVLEGYSAATKWCLLNPEETIDFMIDDINPELGIQERETLTDQMQWNVTISVNEETREEGLGWFSEEGLQSTLDSLSVAAADPEAVPEASEIMVRDPVENAELATLDDDEWEEVRGYAEEQFSYFD